MPFIGGRYYANALAGHAIEAAREAEAALLALKKKSANGGAHARGSADRGADSDGGDEHMSTNSERQDDAPHTPIHRVEIEAAELVPSHSGRAQRGFVARVHREPGTPGDVSSAADASRAPLPGQIPSRGYAPKPETHVFAGHEDLLDFLKNELGKTCNT
jgi:hypothetical protein